MSCHSYSQVHYIFLWEFFGDLLNYTFLERLLYKESENQCLQLDPLQNGYFKHSDGMLKPVTTELLPAPKAILELVQCKCKSDCSSGRCSCKAKDLACTDMCQCSSQCQNDDDSQAVMYESDDDYDDV